MIQKQNSLPDSKQDPFYEPDNSSVSGNFNPKSASDFYGLLVMNIKTYSYVVDWQLPKVDQPVIEKSLF